MYVHATTTDIKNIFSFSVIASIVLYFKFKYYILSYYYILCLNVNSLKMLLKLLSMVYNFRPKSYINSGQRDSKTFLDSFQVSAKEL